MKSQTFNISKENAYKACKTALKKFECDIVFSSFGYGEIQAKKGSNLLSYGHTLTILIAPTTKNTIKVSVSSSSIGIQLFDWGTNSKNEKQLIQIIANSLQ